MTANLFVALVAGMTALFAYAALRTGHSRGAGFGVIALVIAGWLVIPAALAIQGALDRYHPLPAPALLVVLVITLGTVTLALSSFGTRLATGLPLAGLVGFQVFRVVVEWLLHRLYLEGVLPVQMTYAGLNFDIVTGVTGAALGLWLWFGGRSRPVVVAWNVLGLLLLTNIVTIAVLSTPVPFRQFMNDPPNLLPGTFPYVWLPTFLVQAALFGHLLVFRALRQSR